MRLSSEIICEIGKCVRTLPSAPKMKMNYLERIKRMLNDRVEPSRDKKYEIFCCLLKGLEDGELYRFTFADAYFHVQETMPEAKFDEVQHSVRMLDFTGHVKWMCNVKQGGNYIPMFQSMKKGSCQ